MKYKCVIFDLDGTLLNTLGDLHLSLNRALEKAGIPLRSETEVKSFVGNGVEMLVKRALGEEYVELLPQVLKDFKADYSLHGSDTTAPYDGIENLLEKLNKSGVKCAIVSNKYDAAVKQLSAKYFGNLIITAVGESENVRKKPEPDSVLKVISELNADKDSTVFIGDSDVDIETARRAGIDCISVTWGYRTREFLHLHGAKEFADTADELFVKLV